MMRVMTPERDWERLGRAFAAARKAAEMSQVEAADQLHVSRTAVQAIERGRQSNGAPFLKITSTMRAYARLIGWTGGLADVAGCEIVVSATEYAVAKGWPGRLRGYLPQHWPAGFAPRSSLRRRPGSALPGRG